MAININQKEAEARIGEIAKQFPIPTNKTAAVNKLIDAVSFMPPEKLWEVICFKPKVERIEPRYT